MRISQTVKVGPLGKKIEESRMRWFGHNDSEKRGEIYKYGEICSITHLSLVVATLLGQVVKHQHPPHPPCSANPESWPHPLDETTPAI